MRKTAKKDDLEKTQKRLLGRTVPPNSRGKISDYFEVKSHNVKGGKKTTFTPNKILSRGKKLSQSTSKSIIGEKTNKKELKVKLMVDFFENISKGRQENVPKKTSQPSSSTKNSTSDYITPPYMPFVYSGAEEFHLEMAARGKHGVREDQQQPF